MVNRLKINMDTNMALWYLICCVMLVNISVLASGEQDFTDQSDMHDNHGDSERYPQFELHNSGKAPRNKIRVTTVLEPPYMMIKTHGMFLTGNDRYEGMLADIVKLISERAELDYEINLSRDGLYGQEGENGTWSGMIGEIYRGEADLAVGPLTITSKRSHVVQFTEPFMAYQSAAILKRPRHRKHERVPRSRAKIRTLEELHQSGIQYGVITGSMTASIIERSRDPLLNAMWYKMSNSWPTAFVYNAQEGVQRAEHEQYAFITDSPLAEFVTIRKPCHLYKTGNFLDRQYYAFAVKQSDNTLRDIINEQVLRMRTNGELDSLRSRWWLNECDRKREVKDGVADEMLRKTTLSPWRFATAQSFPIKNTAAKRFDLNFLFYAIMLCLTHYSLNS